MPITTANVSYTNPKKRSNSVEKAVVDYSKVDTRNFASAKVKCTPMAVGGDTWHKGGTDKNAPEHITVEYLGPQGQHITTVHLDKNGKRV